MWEALLLSERGRVALNPDPHRWIRKALSIAPLAEDPLTVDVALPGRSVDIKHQDPADRFIVATARGARPDAGDGGRALAALPGHRGAAEPLTRATARIAFGMESTVAPKSPAGHGTGETSPPDYIVWPRSRYSAISRSIL